jgi:hypothetical protein
VTPLVPPLQLHISGNRVSTGRDFSTAGMGTFASNVCKSLILLIVNAGVRLGGFGTQPALLLKVVSRIQDDLVRTSPHRGFLDSTATVY